MIPQGLITQLAMIAIAVGIVFTYIKPMFEQVSASQDQIAVYRDELEKVRQVNATLNSLLARADDMSEDDRRRLYTYMPNSVDTIAVQRDLLLIAEAAGIQVTSVGVGTEGAGVSTQTGEVSLEEGSTGRSMVVPYAFNLDFSAPYDEIKNFLSTLESNEYPLVVTEMTIAGSGEGGASENVNLASLDTLPVQLTLETYALELLEDSY